MPRCSSSSSPRVWKYDVSSSMAVVSAVLNDVHRPTAVSGTCGWVSRRSLSASALAMTSGSVCRSEPAGAAARRARGARGGAGRRGCPAARRAPAGRSSRSPCRRPTAATTRARARRARRHTCRGCRRGRPAAARRREVDEAVVGLLVDDALEQGAGDRRRPAPARAAARGSPRPARAPRRRTAAPSPARATRTTSARTRCRCSGTPSHSPDPLADVGRGQPVAGDLLGEEVLGDELLQVAPDLVLALGDDRRVRHRQRPAGAGTARSRRTSRPARRPSPPRRRVDVAPDPVVVEVEGQRRRPPRRARAARRRAAASAAARRGGRRRRARVP